MTETIFGIPADQVRCRTCGDHCAKWTVGGVETPNPDMRPAAITAVIVHFWCEDHLPKDDPQPPRDLIFGTNLYT
jgi:hypothetical protein